LKRLLLTALLLVSAVTAAPKPPAKPAPAFCGKQTWESVYEDNTFARWTVDIRPGGVVTVDHGGCGIMWSGHWERVGGTVYWWAAYSWQDDPIQHIWGTLDPVTRVGTRTYQDRAEAFSVEKN
jgi:hypothetical protein